MLWYDDFVEWKRVRPITGTLWWSHFWMPSCPSLVCQWSTELFHIHLSMCVQWPMSKTGSIRVMSISSNYDHQTIIHRHLFCIVLLLNTSASGLYNIHTLHFSALLLMQCPNVDLGFYKVLCDCYYTALLYYYFFSWMVVYLWAIVILWQMTIPYNGFTWSMHPLDTCLVH